MPDNVPGVLPRKEPIAALAVRWVSDYLHVGLTSVGAVATAIGGGLVSIWSPNKADWLHTWPGWLLLGGTLVTFVGACLSAARQARLSQLVETIAQLRREKADLEDEFGRTQETHQKMLRDYLVELAAQLRLSGNERISLYAHDGRNFRPLSRYAERPEFDRRGRPEYNQNEGVIGRAWADGDGKHFVSELPDPITDWRGYADRLLNDYGISEATAKAFVMKSRCLAACVVLDSANAGRQRIAVIVVESTLPNGLNADKTFKVIRREQKALRSLLRRLRPYMPDLSIAREAGF